MNYRVDSLLNFRLYDLQLPEILCLNSMEKIIKYRNIFDAIICDPPYGIRARIKSTE